MPEKLQNKSELPQNCVQTYKKLRERGPTRHIQVPGFFSFGGPHIQPLDPQETIISRPLGPNSSPHPHYNGLAYALVTQILNPNIQYNALGQYSILLYITIDRDDFYVYQQRRGTGLLICLNEQLHYLMAFFYYMKCCGTFKSTGAEHSMICRHTTRQRTMGIAMMRVHTAGHWHHLYPV